MTSKFLDIWYQVFEAQSEIVMTRFITVPEYHTWEKFGGVKYWRIG